MIIQPIIAGYDQNKIPHPVLENNTPGQILFAARSGKAKELWSVGDSIPIYLKHDFLGLSLDGIYRAVIIDFNHNAKTEGDNTIHFEIGENENGTKIAFCDSKYGTTITEDGYFGINGGTLTTAGGWEQSKIRNEICQGFFDALPAEWQSVITPCIKYTDNVGGGTSMYSPVTPTEDKIWLISAGENMTSNAVVFYNLNENEWAKQYDYYRDANNRTRYKHDDLNTKVNWWTRSIYVAGRDKGASDFVSITDTGGQQGKNVNQSFGVVPCFKIG